MQHGHGVARAVAQRQDDLIGTQLVAGRVVEVLNGQAANVPFFNQHVTHALFKTHLTAQRNDLLAHVLDHLDQREGAKVGLADQQDLFGCTRFDKLLHDLAAQVARVLDLAPELAV